MNDVSIMRSDDAWIFVASFGTVLSLNDIMYSLLSHIRFTVVLQGLISTVSEYKHGHKFSKTNLGEVVNRV